MEAGQSTRGLELEDISSLLPCEDDSRSLFCIGYMTIRPRAFRISELFLEAHFHSRNWLVEFFLCNPFK